MRKDDGKGKEGGGEILKIIFVKKRRNEINHKWKKYLKKVNFSIFFFF